MITEAELQAIEDRLRQASDGPWLAEATKVFREGGYPYETCDPRAIASLNDGEYIENMNGENDARFIAHARQDIPKLIAACRAALSEQASRRGERG